MISNEIQNANSETIAKHRALIILRVLVDDEINGAINEFLLSDLLDIQGMGCGREKLRSCLRFLEQSGLIVTTIFKEFTVIRITREGDEVAHGKVHVQGVQPFTVTCLY